MAAQKSVSDIGPEIRSPLAERSNRNLQKKPEPVKPLEKKMAKTEIIRPAVKNVGRTLSQDFLKTKTLKKQQTNNENIKPEATKHDPKPPTKPLLGAYRGKIVQSKINSFWKSTENQNVPEPSKTVQKRQVERPQHSTSVLAKTTARPLANNVKPRRPVIPPVSSSIKPSTTVTKSRSEPVTVRRTTHVLNQQRSIQQKPQPVKPPLKDGAVKKNLVKQSEKKSSGPAKTLPEPAKKKPAPQPTASKFSRPKETPEERKARLEEWQKTKGKVIKRPSMATVMPSASNVPKEETKIKTEPEEPKEEPPRQLYWATMAEEDEQELFTLKVRQIFGGCQKLIDEGCPKEEVLSILEKQIQAVPEAKKLSGYWECLARLEKRDGQLYKVIAVCEEAVAAGAQPLEELRAILADALEQLKPPPEESVKVKAEDLKSEELKAEVKEETVETTVKGRKRRGKVRAVTNEPPRSPSTPEKPSRPESTPENGGATSSVIRFNVCTTPHLEKMKKLQMNEGESSIKSYKFLTPVRRSSRLERKSHRLPDMLKDHDPCLSGIYQLGDLEETETCTNAYIFRKNSALNDITAKSATK
ncbi:cytoskeleton-associated protein 2 isoform X2 [Hyla sarda]|nr:cytoskeleton-associated protein 2 isoform X2 [Hyla sarda]